MNIYIQQVDYHNPVQGQDLILLLSDYALDPMGGGQPLDQKVKHCLLAELSKLPYAISFLAYVDGKAVGLLNGFEGFSTFRAKPLLNIHDLVVDSGYRGKGIGAQLLHRAEAYGRERGFSKLTLEVLSGNHLAKGLYQKMGFDGYQLQADTGSAEFWQKNLD